jgi:hypothetical protein
MDRLTLAYTFIGALIAASAAIMSWKMYYSRTRTILRARRQAMAVHEALLAKRAGKRAK